jgi:hypothetical protein
MNHQWTVSKAIHLIFRFVAARSQPVTLYMKSRKNNFAVLVPLGLSAFSSNEKALAAGNKYTIALIPGITQHPAGA